jgi:hypothetical protein
MQSTGYYCQILIKLESSGQFFLNTDINHGCAILAKTTNRSTDQPQPISQPANKENNRLRN